MFDICIYGDISGDGKITLEDLMLLSKSKQLLDYGDIDLSQIATNSEAAADADVSGAINNNDFIAMLDHIFGREIITYVGGAYDG